ncbi:hypothetical protein [Pedobacter africanus]|uniref:hypothetical protein n=1 Tax=Pedobacter africanus TaxID=151894 RepID=UPI000A042744|nr:hypothetical protein [Pedobacter africanus]
MNDEEIHIRLDTLLEQQQELLMLARAIHTRLPPIDLQPAEEEVWLTKEKVMDYLCISERSFYRRKLNPNWKKRKSGGIWYYLKASLLQQEHN